MAIEDNLRRAIERAGGLVNAPAIARDWGVSLQRAHQIIRAEDFPPPVTTIAGRPVWARCQTDAWRKQRVG